MPAPSSYSRQSSTSRSRASVSSHSSYASGSSQGSLVGSSSFQVGRTRDRSAEMELFRKQIEMFGDSLCQSRKPRSNYRRPSNLGLSADPLPTKTESKGKYTPQPASRNDDSLFPYGIAFRLMQQASQFRSHIVAKIPDHLRPEGSFQADSEIRANFRNLSPARPIIHKLQDSLKPEGSFAKASETKASYENKNPRRPVIHKLRDHGEDVQPKGEIPKNSEYRNSFSPVKGERATPAWITNFEKVTIGGGNSRE